MSWSSPEMLTFLHAVLGSLENNFPGKFTEVCVKTSVVHPS